MFNRKYMTKKYINPEVSRQLTAFGFFFSKNQFEKNALVEN